MDLKRKLLVAYSILSIYDYISLEGEDVEEFKNNINSAIAVDFSTEEYETVLEEFEGYSSSDIENIIITQYFN